MLSFKHSGDAGDIIYSLPVIRYMGGGVLFLSKENYTRLKLTEDRLPQFEKLLVSQPYIRAVKFYYGREVGVDLNKFRDRFAYVGLDESLAQMHCRAFGVPETELDKPWISVEPRHEADVIINLTSRYRNNEFPWGLIYRKYKKVAALVGSHAEWCQFEKHYGPIKHCKTKDLLEVAQVIRGSKLFIGNQSCPLAIAHAMQHPTVCELSRNSYNGMVRTINCAGSAGANIDLPDV